MVITKSRIKCSVSIFGVPYFLSFLESPIFSHFGVTYFLSFLLWLPHIPGKTIIHLGLSYGAYNDCRALKIFTRQITPQDESRKNWQNTRGDDI